MSPKSAHTGVPISAQCQAGSFRGCEQSDRQIRCSYSTKWTNSVGFQSDPAAALLEVLYPAQNSSYTDNYL